MVFYNGRHFRNILMKFKIDHIGYVVKNLNNTLKYYKNNYNFIPITKIIIEKAHGVKLIFLDLGTSSVPALELIQPINKKSKVYNFLKRNGDSFHHLAYEVENINKSIIFLKKKNFLQISTIVPGAGHNRANTVWLMGNKKELIELVEKQKNLPNYKRFTR